MTAHSQPLPSELPARTRHARRPAPPRATPYVLALFGCLLLSGCGPSSTDLVQVDSEKEANHILTVLAAAAGESPDAAPIRGTKSGVEKQRRTVWQVRVPSKDVENARRVLLAHDLPKDRHPGLAGLAAGSGLIPSRTDERARLMDAIAGELKATIESIDGVVSARVHVVVPERDALAGPGEAPNATRASVVVQTSREKVLAVISRPPGEAAGSAPSPATRVDEVRVAEIVRDLVRNAVDGLDDKNLSVSVIPVTPVRAVEAPMTEWRDIASAARARAFEPKSLAVLFTAGIGLALVFFLVFRR